MKIRLIGALVLFAVGLAPGEPLSQTKQAVDAALKEGVTKEEFESLKPQLLAHVDFKNKFGDSLKALSMMYQLGACMKGEGGAAIEADAVGRFIEAKVDSRELDEAAWKQVSEFISSVSAMGEGERDPQAFHRPLAYLDRIRAAGSSPRIGAMALHAKLRAALIIDRILTKHPLDASTREKIVAEVKSAPKEYAAVAVDGARTFESAVGPMRFELENLYVGRPAPDSVGVDLDGKPMSLSEYRGKTVLLVGWANWCPDCIKAIPGEKALMEKLAAKPVAFVGINGDEKSKDGKASAAKHGVPGRSFWGRWPGGDGKQVTLVDQWNIRFWPSYYVIDPAGVIRYKRCWDTEPSDLEKEINTILAEAKGK